MKMVINYFIVFLAQFATSSVWSESPSKEKVASLPDKSSSIELHILSLPGEIEIENTSASTVLLDWKIYVEMRKNDKWSLVYLFPQPELVEACSVRSLPKTTPCFELAPKATFEPLPWTGFNCSSQCNYNCYANGYLGPGIFRYIFHSCDKSQKFYSPPFTLPADDGTFWLRVPGKLILDGMRPAENHP